MWYTFFKNLSFCFFYWPHKVTIYGRENVPMEGPVLLLSNHQSFMDPSLCQGPIKRDFHFLARHTLFESAIGKLFPYFNCIPVNRDKPELSTMKRVIAVLKGGGAICLFPEATRTRDGKIADLKPGFGLFARRTNATVIPIALEGPFDCWPRGKRFPSRKPITVIYGEPIDASKVKELGDEKFAVFITGTLRRLQNEAREKMGKEPFDYPDVLSGLISEETSEDIEVSQEN